MRKLYLLNWNWVLEMQLVLKSWVTQRWQVKRLHMLVELQAYSQYPEIVHLTTCASEVLQVNYERSNALALRITTTHFWRNVHHVLNVHSLMSAVRMVSYASPILHMQCVTEIRSRCDLNCVNRAFCVTTNVKNLVLITYWNANVTDFLPGSYSAPNIINLVDKFYQRYS